VSTPLKIIFAVLAGMLLTGLIIYDRIGTPEAIDLPIAQAEPGPQSMEEAITQLEARLGSGTGQKEEWLLLGRSYKIVKRFEDAEHAFVQAMIMAPEDPEIMVELAETMTMASGDPRFSDRAIELLQTAVDSDGTLQKALWLRGMAATQRGENDVAIANWERLLSQLPAGSDVANTVQKQIAEAQGREFIPAQSINIPINVSLGPELDSQLPESSVLYVFARRPGGGGMPLAVVRLPRPEFPAMVSLSEKNLLQPGSNLDGPLQITARLSMSGSATPGAGDFRAAAIMFETLPDAPIEIELNTVITP
jgi:cytochrome c-type biogenesis protein CcmH